MEEGSVLIDRKGKRDPWAGRDRPKGKPTAWRYRKGLSGKQWERLVSIMRTISKIDPLYFGLTDEQVACLIKVHFGLDVVRVEFIAEARRFSAIAPEGFSFTGKAKAEKI